METLLYDLRHAVRRLARSPGFTAVTVLTLALGIGAGTAVYCVVDHVLLRPLAYPDADTLVALFAGDPDGAAVEAPTSPARYLDWKRRSLTLERMTAAHLWSPTLTGSGDPDRLTALKATPELFELLGVAPALGRTFDPRAEPGADPRVAVLGYGLWQRRFAADPAAVGTTLTLDGEPYTVVGVMPPGFRFPPFWATDAELWAPLVFTPEQTASRGAYFLRVFARLAPGAGMDGVRAELAALGTALDQDYPETPGGESIRVDPLREPVVDEVRRPLAALLGAVGFVLVLCCLNVAALMLGRAAGFGRELAVRSALGASPRRMVRLWLSESLVLAVAGGGAGTLLAAWGVDLIARLAPAGLPRIDEIALDGRVLAVALAVTVVVGLGSGAVPALRAARRRAITAGLGGDGRGSRRTGSPRLRAVLVAAQVGLALALLVGAGLMLRSFAHLTRIDPGFDPNGLLTLSVALAGSSHEEPARQQIFFDRLVEEVEALPGVSGAAMVNHLPLGGDLWSLGLAFEGRPAPDPRNPPSAAYRVVGPGYFATLGVPVLGGRGFDPGDTADSIPVAIVNRALARDYFGDADPVGRRIRFGGDSEPWRTVVGVVDDVRQWQITDPVRPEVYLPYPQNMTTWFTQASLVVRTAAAVPGLADEIRGRVRELDPAVPVVEVRTMARILGDDLAGARLATWLLGFFAGVALLLAGLGIYGTIAYLGRQRFREFGIRMALGARRGAIFRMVVGRGLALAAAGAALGLGAALLLQRAVSGLLYELSPTDPATYAGVVALLALAALAASYRPARRATRVDPVTTLRED
jgi:putative ABC transport system permease protein